MAACRIVYASVDSAVQAIGTSQQNLKTAGDNFVTAFKSAIAEMEGASKDALSEFFKNSVEPFATDSLPSAVKGMQDLLQANLTNFVDVDQQIASSIGG